MFNNCNAGAWTKQLVVQLHPPLSNERLDGWKERMGGFMAAVSQPLVDERDRLMAYALHTVSSARPGSTTVAVLGRAHLPGIKRHFGQASASAEACAPLAELPGDELRECAAKVIGASLVSGLVPLLAYRALRRRSPTYATYARRAYGAFLVSAMAFTGYSATQRYSMVRRLQLEVARSQE